MFIPIVGCTLSGRIGYTFHCYFLTNVLLLFPFCFLLKLFVDNLLEREKEGEGERERERERGERERERERDREREKKKKTQSSSWTGY